MSFEAVELQDVSGFQSIKLPENLRINDDKVYLRKIGDTLYVIPFHNPWQNLLQSLDQFTPDFMEEKSTFADDQNVNLFLKMSLKEWRG
jgi:antitoxin VapB